MGNIIEVLVCDCLLLVNDIDSSILRVLREVNDDRMSYDVKVQHLMRTGVEVLESLREIREMLNDMASGDADDDSRKGGKT